MVTHIKKLINHPVPDLTYLNSICGWATTRMILHLAIEYDNFDILKTDEYWSLMLLANYQFTDWFAATLRYTHEDYETSWR